MIVKPFSQFGRYFAYARSIQQGLLGEAVVHRLVGGRRVVVGSAGQPEVELHLLVQPVFAQAEPQTETPPVAVLLPLGVASAVIPQTEIAKQFEVVQPTRQRAAGGRVVGDRFEDRRIPAGQPLCGHLLLQRRQARLELLDRLSHLVDGDLLGGHGGPTGKQRHTEGHCRVSTHRDSFRLAVLSSVTDGSWRPQPWPLREMPLRVVNRLSPSSVSVHHIVYCGICRTGEAGAFSPSCRGCTEPASLARNNTRTNRSS